MNRRLSVGLTRPENQEIRCTKCRQQKPMLEYDRNASGALLKSCRGCLNKKAQSDAKKKRKAGNNHGRGSDSNSENENRPARKRHQTVNTRPSGTRQSLGNISNSMLNVINMAGPAYTYHPREDEGLDIAKARRAADAEKRKQRRRNRAQQRGDILSSQDPLPPPQTPSPRAQQPQSGIITSDPLVLPDRMDTPPRRRRHVQGSKIRQHYFTCSSCNTHRPIALLPRNTSINEQEPSCYFCLMAIGEGDVEVKYCTDCKVSKPRLQFMNDTGEKDTCNACLPSSQSLENENNASQPEEETSDRSTVNPAISEKDWGYVESFYSALDEIHLDECQGCEEKWFDMSLDSEGICKACRGSKHRRALFTKENHANPPSLPQHLPELTEIEEMLIARAHVHVQVRQVKGQQYKYAGHTVCFMQNTQKIYRKLPLLPQDLDIALLKPASGQDPEENVAISRSFERQFRVNRRNVSMWLYWLKTHHPDYFDIEVDLAALSALPENGSIHQQLITREMPHGTGNAEATGPAAEQGESNAEDGLDTSVVVPDLQPQVTEMERIRQDLAVPTNGVSLSVASFEARPVSEFDGKPILRMVFPTLFPNGDGDFSIKRQHTIPFNAWIKHLLRYRDDRFARHPRFRYVAFNMLMREQARNQSNYACKQFNGQKMTVEELRELVDQGEEDQLIKQVTRQAQNLRGTRPYWGRKRTELEAVVRNLGCPHLFFTLSAADIQWNDLHKHMPNFPGEREFLLNPERHRVASQNLTNNPHIAAWYLQKRVSLFVKHVIKKLFPVQDWWYRFEWQARGSGHVHGFLWIEERPAPTTKTVEARVELAEYWSRYITAVNPDRTRPQVGVNPASVPFSERKNEQDHLTECLNCFQRHKNCTPAYCLKRRKLPARTNLPGQASEPGIAADVGNQEIETTLQCRFHYPRPCRDTATVSKDLNLAHYMYLAERNDPFLNAYNSAVTLGWIGNTDMQPCTNASLVLNYIAKYASKSESKSQTYKEILHAVLRNSNNENAPALVVFIRAMNKLIGERDWHAQEVMHHLLDCDLVVSSRLIVHLNVKPAEEQPAMIVEVDDGNVEEKSGRSWLQKYMDRNKCVSREGASPRHVTLWEFARQWELKSAGNNLYETYKRPRAQPRVLNIYPLYSHLPESAHYEDFCRVKMMLHHPFETWADLEAMKIAENEDATPSYIGAYNNCLRAGCAHERDCLDPLDGEDDDDISEYEDDDEEPEIEEQPPWVALAERHSRFDGAVTDLEATTCLGKRTIDLSYNWHSNDHRYDIYGDQSNFYTRARTVAVEIPRTDAGPESLQRTQRLLYDLVLNHYHHLAREQRPQAKQLLLHVDGEAGTGKSYIIDMLSKGLYEAAAAYNKPDPVCRVAPTGVAAFNIYGKTLHSLFRLPIRGKYSALANTTLRQLQRDLQYCRFLIIDEKSMVSLRQLHWIDQRLREIIPNHATDLFGGLNILLFGDFYQLPPVAAQALYDIRPTTKNDEEITRAQILYSAFDRTIVLDQVMRQQGEDQESMMFRGTLRTLRTGRITTDGINLLRTRVASNLSMEERKTFESALRVYPKTDMVQTYNISTLENNDSPAILVHAEHSSARAKRASAEEAEGLHAQMYYGLGARVMLTSNLLTSFGLVNGTMGSIHDIIWRLDDDPTHKLPIMILFKPDKYDLTFPNMYIDYSGIEPQAIIPVFPVTKEFEIGSQKLTRKMFPLVLAYAITIHKSQGLTLPRVVMDIQDRDFSPGLTYVGVSRVRSLKGLMFERDFGRERFYSDAGGSALSRLRDDDFFKRSTTQAVRSPNLVYMV